MPGLKETKIQFDADIYNRYDNFCRKQGQSFAKRLEMVMIKDLVENNK